jgi:16S rRNA pseudouridine516 synthase
MRIDRFVATKLGCSTRSVRHLCAERRIRLNGVTVTDGCQVISKFCRVEVEGRILQHNEPVYLMMHKPRGCVSATSDRGHATVLDLVDLPSKERLHLAGRLDFNTTGLLLLTNDGNWSRSVTLPQHRIPKTYRVRTRREITTECVEKFAAGMYFRYEDLTTLPARLTLLSARTAEVTIHEGRYHQIRRMFGFFRNEVICLHRLAVGGIALDPGLRPGEYRHLAADEVAALRSPVCDA